MRPIPKASLASHVDLGGLFPVDSAFQARLGREFWLSTVHGGRIPLQGGWEALGSPQEVLVIESQDDPGVALVSADVWATRKYRKRKVGVTGKVGRVSLSSASLHRLQVTRDGQQLLLTMAHPFLVVLNPMWLPELSYWDRMAEKVSS